MQKVFRVVLAAAVAVAIVVRLRRRSGKPPVPEAPDSAGSR